MVAWIISWLSLVHFVLQVYPLYKSEDVSDCSQIKTLYIHLPRWTGRGVGCIINMRIANVNNIALQYVLIGATHSFATKRSSIRAVHTRREIFFEILLNQTEIRLYLPFPIDLKQQTDTSVCFQIGQGYIFIIFMAYHATRCYGYLMKGLIKTLSGF